MAREAAIGFAIGNKGYIGTGINNFTFFQDFWEYNQATNSWTQKANFVGGARSLAVGFSIGSKGYLGTGWDNSNSLKDFWEYNPSINTWTSQANLPASSRYNAVGFSICKDGYIGTGYDNTIFYNDFWEYASSSVISITASSTTICHGNNNNVTLSASGGNTYSWSNGSTTNQISVSPTSTSSYSVVASIGSCTDTASVTITVNSFPIANISSNSTICSGQSTNLTASGGTYYAWSNSSTTSTITVAPTSTSTYSVSVSNGFCYVDTSIIVTVYLSPIAIISGNANICSGQTTTFNASGGGIYLWNTGATTNSIFISPSSTTSYSVTVTSLNGCTDDTNATVVVTQTPVALISPNSTICLSEAKQKGKKLLFYK